MKKLIFSLKTILLLLVGVTLLLSLTSCGKKVDIEEISLDYERAYLGDYKPNYISKYDNGILRIKFNKPEDIIVSYLKVRCDDNLLKIDDKEIEHDGTIVSIRDVKYMEGEGDEKVITQDNTAELYFSHKNKNVTIEILDICYDGKWQGKQLSNNTFTINVLSPDDFNFEIENNVVTFNYNKDLVESFTYELLDLEISKNGNVTQDNNKLTFGFIDESLRNLICAILKFKFENGYYYMKYTYSGVIKQTDKGSIYASHSTANSCFIPVNDEYYFVN